MRLTNVSLPHGFHERFHARVRPYYEAAHALTLAQRLAMGRWAGLILSVLCGVLLQFSGKITIFNGVILCGLALMNYHFFTSIKFRPAQYKVSAGDLQVRGVNEVVQIVAPQFRYTRSAPQLDQLVRQAKLFDNFKNIEFVREQGCVAGRLGGADVAVVVVQAGYYREVTETVGNRKVKRKVEEICFDGYLVLADFPRRFEGWVTIAPDHVESKLGWLVNEWREIRDQSVVRLENIDFERDFIVRASDPVVAHYVLSASTIEDLMALREQMQGAGVVGSFFDSTMILAIPELGGKFSLRGDDPSEWLSACEADATRLLGLLQILKDLKIGQTIWRAEEKVS